ncbi:MAG: hypothetical protein NVSMB25_04810 [Thermoleophilaceae bacterium]
MIGEGTPGAGDHSRSRRDLLVATLALAAGGGVTLLASSARDARTKPSPTRSTTTTEAEADLALLNDLVVQERRSIAAYTLAVDQLADSDARRSAAIFLIHERQHAAALERSIRDLGASPVADPTTADFEADLAANLSRHAILELIVAIEHDAIAGYVDALESASVEDVRVTTAAVLATEAAHLAVVLEDLGRAPLTGAFVAPAQSFQGT